MSEWEGRDEDGIPIENISVSFQESRHLQRFAAPGEDRLRGLGAWVLSRSPQRVKDAWRTAEARHANLTEPGFLGWVFFGFGWLMWLAAWPLWTSWSAGRFFLGVACLWWALGLIGLTAHEVIVYRRRDYPRK